MNDLDNTTGDEVNRQEKLKRKKEARRRKRRAEKLKKDNERLHQRVTAPDALEHGAELYQDAVNHLRDLGGESAVEKATKHAADVRDMAHRVLRGQFIGHFVADTALKFAREKTIEHLSTSFIAAKDRDLEAIYELACMLKVLLQEEEPDDIVIELASGVPYKFSVEQVEDAWHCAMSAAARFTSFKVNGKFVELFLPQNDEPGWKETAMKADATLRRVFDNILRSKGREDLITSAEEVAEHYGAAP